MRLRRKPEADAFLKSHTEIFIDEPETKKGQIKSLFPVDQPLRIEIGMGKGDFIIELAKRNPDINFIGIEKYDSVLFVAMKKVLDLETPLPNLRLMRADAITLKDIFEANEIDRVYLNFSDPWPKSRHYKRRLTYKDFLAVYEHILVDKGYVEFKTDNRGLFDFSVETLQESKIWKMTECTYDLHNDDVMNVGNIMTEYEEKFSSMNNPICKLIAMRKGDK